MDESGQCESLGNASNRDRDEYILILSLHTIYIDLNHKAYPRIATRLSGLQILHAQIHFSLCASSRINSPVSARTVFSSSILFRGDIRLYAERAFPVFRFFVLVFDTLYFAARTNDKTAFSLMRPILGASNIYSRGRHHPRPPKEKGVARVYGFVTKSTDYYGRFWLANGCVVRIHDAKKRLFARHEKKKGLYFSIDIANNFREREKLDTALCKKTLRRRNCR